MKLTLILTFISLFKIQAESYSQNTKITINLESVKVLEVLETIESLTEYKFLVNESIIDQNRLVSIKVKNKRIYKILDELFVERGITYKVVDRQIILIKSKIQQKAPNNLSPNQIGPLKPEQEQEINGTVKDKSGLPLTGVNVIISGTTRGVQTDFDGKYSITASTGDVLSFSFLGMKTTTVTVGNTLTIDIIMEEDTASLEEVVVTALGIKKEAKKLGYSIQTVQGDDLTKVRSVNVASTLSGRVTGVQINQNGTGVGGSSAVTVRGITSLVPGQNSALIVVDGVILDGGSLGQGNFSEGLDYGNALSDINPDDIQSINVLKGGNATALYGYRGSAGVIVITTKSGKSGKVKVDISSSVTFDNVLVTPKLQNSYGQGRYDVATGELIYDITRAGSWGPALDNSQQLRFDGVGTAPYSANPDDFKDFYRTGATVINSVGLSGGSDIINYRLSYSNLFNQPILPGSDFKRQSLSLNTNTNVTDKLKVQAKISYIKNTAVNRSDITDGQANTVRALILKSRSISNADLAANYVNEDGSPNNFGGSSFTMNPYYAVNTKLNEDTKNRYTGLISATYKLTEDLSATARYSQDQSNYDASIFKPRGAFDNAPTGQLREITQQTTTSNYDLLLSYTNYLTERISVNSTLGYSGFENKLKSTTVQADNLLDPSLISVNNFGTKGASTLFSNFKSQSLFGSVQFGFNDYAFIEVTGRNDWSSTLPVDNFSFFYPSVGSSFLLNEIFKIDNKNINLLKLRASWAKTGNATQPYRLRPVYNVSSAAYNGLSIFYFGDPTLGQGAAEEGAAPGTIIPNADLKAELSSEYEFGLDAKFFNNRLGLDLTYYDKETKNQILAISLPSTTGAQSKIINAGLVSNKGVEIALTGTPIKTKNFEWNTAFNFSKNENRIEKLVEELPTTIIARQFNDVIRLVATEGNIYGDLVGPSFMRDEQGRLVYDIDGLPVVGENKVIGNVTPDFLLGINNSFSYKNLDLSFLIDIKSGGDVFSFTDRVASTNGNDIRTLEGRDFYTGGNGVFVPNDAVVQGTLDPDVASRGVDPATLYQRLGNISENWVVDGSYVKLRQVSLTYNFPQNLLSKLSISNASISYIGRNLAILHKNTDNFDPEVGFNTAIQGIEIYDFPSTSSHGIKLNLSF
ncbi:SusC/RagA family TonB-linked outer membrane protein [Aquimarina sediminis]|uniref:SusC/RagA family TonB-linked outer membrane protein n=1 Tax=Aquimarina sediminis TaxID=2070536 RepID=UPI0013E8C25A|nr:SusC/RagA family TonB-linked outer membrane protein [Aquimarina sediminis]